MADLTADASSIMDDAPECPMTTRTHTLKTWPGPFQAIVDGRKRHEVRHDDRGYAVGDTLILREFDPTFHAYTERVIRARVTYLSSGGTWGLPADLCVMSLGEVECCG